MTHESRPAASEARLRAGWLATFPPGYFAFVMATGIVSAAAHLLRVPVLPRALFAVNIAFYPLLWAITLARLARCRAAFLRDLVHHEIGPTFLSKVAATAILGTQVALFTTHQGIALVLWGFAILLWAGLGYAFLGAMTLADPQPPIERALGGSWLLVVVSTQSLSVLGVAVADATPRPDIVAFACLCAFLLGCFSYGILITLIAHRWLFYPMTAAAFTPTYWINMGAAAITAFAGGRLLLYAAAHPGWNASTAAVHVLPVVTAGAWAAASWWIPPLVAAAIWRHAVRRIPLAYEPQHWSVVFPLGMYAAATATYAEATSNGFLLPVAQVFAAAALAAWLAASLGLARRLVGAGPTAGPRCPSPGP